MIAGQQKSGKCEEIPCGPDFVQWLRQTFPDAAEQSGHVVPLIDPTTGHRLGLRFAGRMVNRIGRKAKVKVVMRTKLNKKSGNAVEVPVYAGCDPIRTAFGSIWSRRVVPAVLRRLMRHADISTTIKYYVNQSTDYIIAGCSGVALDPGDRNRPRPFPFPSRNRPNPAKGRIELE